MNAPTLITKRLTLRPHTLDDFPAYVDFMASKRAYYMGGPHNDNVAWSWFCNDIASWSLYGFGNLVITLTHTGEVVGHCGITQGPEFPEPELGWFLYQGYEGKGMAREATVAMRDYGFGEAGLKTFVSYVDADNNRSIKLAKALGATFDPKAATPGNDPAQVYRYGKGAK